jgi:hypothetical protein
MQFATFGHFERAAGVGLIAQCPDCYRIFSCNKSNMYCDVNGSGPPQTFPRPPIGSPGSSRSVKDDD